MTLAQLDAVRYDLDGDGVPTQSETAVYALAFPAAATAMGCPSGGGCTGYELETDLDFDTNGDGRVDAGDEFWEDGRGWEPLGVGGFPLYAIFEGNGRTIRNLFSRRFTGGLFGGNRGVIRRVGLIDVDVSGTAWVGGLIAENEGEIYASYVTGRVSGARRVGGLAGTSYGGPSGSQFVGTITASYSTARVTGTDERVGGLVGVNTGAISASYATGRVSGGDEVGGLIGCGNDGSVVASYATGIVSGGDEVGGLIGSTGCFDGSPVVTAGYWDSGTSGHGTGTGARTTAQLQAPTGYSGIYSQWNVDLDGNGTNDDPWDFGTSSQYPALKMNFDGQGAATWQEFGRQLRAGPTLTATTRGTTAGQAQVDLTWTAADVSHWTPPPDVTYAVTRTDGSTVEVLAEDLGELRYTDPAARTGATYTYRVAIVVDGGEAVRSAVVVNTSGNSPPVPVGTPPDRWLHVGDAAGVEAGAAFQDPEDDTLTYTAGSSATGVARVSVSGTRVTITPVAAGTATITVTATDAGGSTASTTQTFTVTVLPSSAIDYDTDDDGLIEITSLRQLDAVRHDLDGDGEPRTGESRAYGRAFPGVDSRQGCGGLTGCVGYELGADLDFDTNGNGLADKDDEYWNIGKGWYFIGQSPYTQSFQAVFEGNGHTISNLFIDHFSREGLFGLTGPSSVIRHVGLIGVSVSSTDDVGGLVGTNSGLILGSYVTGTVSGTGAAVGGLVGENLGSVVASYAAVEVTGGDDVGGLVGANHAAVIASYATGRVAGGDRVGGLVGSNGSAITASYATGPVAGEADAGGLVGTNEANGSTGTVSVSYWDTTASGLTTGAGQGQTTAQLQAPTDYTGIYAAWNLDLDGDGTNDDPWDFGTSSQYPELRVNSERPPPPPPPPPPRPPSGPPGEPDPEPEPEPDPEPVGVLEIPGPGSRQSGIGLLSGWVCDAEVVELEITGPNRTYRLDAAYGTDRADTEADCGDGDNGFGLLFNWNLLLLNADPPRDDGVFTVRALADGVEFGQATFTVTTLGEEFVRGVTGETVVPDFPTAGEEVRLIWQQANQNFVLAPLDGTPTASPPTPEDTPEDAPVGALENPGQASFQSGIGLLSGWVCEADVVELEIDGTDSTHRLEAAYGTDRADTEDVCGDGDTDNGFGLLFNWNLLLLNTDPPRDDGVFTVRALADGVEFGQATFTVTTLGEEFIRGITGEAVVPDFPTAGEEVRLIWQQANQNFVLAPLR